MTSLLVRSLISSAAKFIPPSSVGRCLLHSSNRGKVAPIFTRTFTTFNPEPSTQKNRNWIYFAAGIFTEGCLQQAYTSLKKAGNEEDENFEELPKPTSSISSGTHKATAYNPILMFKK